MHFAKARNLVIMALAWAIFLLAYEQHKSPKPFAAYWAEFRGASTRPVVVSEGDVPKLRVAMPDACCGACLDEVRSVLARYVWLNPTESREHEVEYAVLDLPRADFAGVGRALRESGLVPERFEVLGMGHFRLELELPGGFACGGAANTQLEQLLRKESQGRWFDSISLDPVDKTVIVYARLNAVADLAELERAVERAGLSARSIRVLTGPES